MCPFQRFEGRSHIQRAVCSLRPESGLGVVVGAGEGSDAKLRTSVGNLSALWLEPMDFIVVGIFWREADAGDELSNKVAR